MSPVEIAGKKTDVHWKGFVSRIKAGKADWEEGYKDFFEERINTRYFDPIDKIIENGEGVGEGFAIVSIQCCLIEFLQTTYEGRNFVINYSSPYEYGLGESKKYI